MNSLKRWIQHLTIATTLLITCSEKTTAQDCKTYYYMTNNAEVQMTLYDAKGKINGVQTWKITNAKKATAGFESTVNANFTDGKGAAIATSTGTYKCSGGKLMADIRMSIPQDQAQKIDAGAAQVTDAFIEYPSRLSEGMSLPDASFSMEANTSGVPSATEFGIKNRKVAGKETITSEAGSWEAYKITYDAVIKIKMAGIGIPMNMKTTEWFVPDFGIVKTETFNKKGKLIGSSLLTKLKK